MSDTTKDSGPDFGEVAAWRRPNGDLYQENPNGFTDWIPLYEHPVAPAQVQAEVVQVIADIKAILMDHRIYHLAIRLNDAMKRIDAYENRSTGDQS